MKNPYKTTPLQIKVGEILKKKRKELKLTLDDVFKLTGISPGNLSHIENGQQNLSLQQLEILEKAYNCEIVFNIKKKKVEKNNTEVC